MSSLLSFLCAPDAAQKDELIMEDFNHEHSLGYSAKFRRAFENEVQTATSLSCAVEVCSTQLLSGTKEKIRTATNLEEEENLLGSQSYVQELPRDPLAVDGEFIRSPGKLPRAYSTPPMDFSVTLPENHEPGQLLRVQGTQGVFEVEPPFDALPGSIVQYALCAKPEFIVEVPPDCAPGSEFKINRSDGVQIEVRVPDDKTVGMRFEVRPPAIMVLMPEDAVAGDVIAFRAAFSDKVEVEPSTEAATATTWCRCVAPEGIRLGQYFTVRLPAPNAPLQDQVFAAL